MPSICRTCSNEQSIARHSPEEILHTEHVHDLGKLMLSVHPTSSVVVLPGGVGLVRLIVRILFHLLVVSIWVPRLRHSCVGTLTVRLVIASINVGDDGLAPTNWVRRSR